MIVLFGTCLAATTFDTERFHAAVSGELLGVPTAWAAGETGLGGRFLAAGAVAPVVLAQADGSETRLVASRWGGELGVRYHQGRFDAALSLPASRVDGALDGPRFVLGDARVELLGRIVSLGPSALGATASLRLPSGDATRWSGAGRVSGAGALVASTRYAAASGSVVVGVDAASPYDTPAFRWGPQLTWGAGVAVALPFALRALGEIDGAIPLNEGGGAAPGEWRLGAGYRADPTLDLTLAVGRGYTTGVGNPDLRLLTSLVVHPRPRRRPPSPSHP